MTDERELLKFFPFLAILFTKTNSFLPIQELWVLLCAVGFIIATYILILDPLENSF